MANAPHNWLKAAIEAASAGVYAWPVEMTGQGDPPYVIYTREQTERQPLLSDTLDYSPGMNELPPVARFEVVVYADSYVEAWEIAGLIAAAIHRFKGSEHGETIHECQVVDERDGDAGYLEGREQPTYTVEMAVEIRYEE
jgi:hypothetical protein